jgi:hypothetical protein
VKAEVPAPVAVHFEIGRVTLHGYSAAQRTQFVASLRAHLAEVGASGSWSGSGPARRRVGRLDAGALPPGASPHEAARRVATALRSAAGAESLRPATARQQQTGAS